MNKKNLIISLVSLFVVTGMVVMFVASCGRTDDVSADNSDTEVAVSDSEQGESDTTIDDKDGESLPDWNDKEDSIDGTTGPKAEDASATTTGTPGSTAA